MRFLCRVGFHSWESRSGFARPCRKCTHCPRTEFLHRGAGSDQWFEVSPDVKPLTPEEILIRELEKEGFDPFPTNVSFDLTIGAALNWPAKSVEDEIVRMKGVVENVAKQEGRIPVFSGPHFWAGGVFVGVCGLKNSTSASS